MRSNHPVRLGTLFLVTLSVPVGARTSTALPTVRTQPPVLIAFDINDGAKLVERTDVLLTLSHRVTGSVPAEYRVSSRSDFSGAVWRRYAMPLRIRDWLTFARAGAHCQENDAGSALVLYLQVRSQTGSTVQIVDGRRVTVLQMTESNVVMDSICVLRENESDSTGSA